MYSQPITLPFNEINVKNFTIEPTQINGKTIFLPKYSVSGKPCRLFISLPCFRFGKGSGFPAGEFYSNGKPNKYYKPKPEERSTFSIAMDRDLSCFVDDEGSDNKEEITQFIKKILEIDEYFKNNTEFKKQMKIKPNISYNPIYHKAEVELDEDGEPVKDANGLPLRKKPDFIRIKFDLNYGTPAIKTIIKKFNKVNGEYELLDNPNIDIDELQKQVIYGSDIKMAISISSFSISPLAHIGWGPSIKIIEMGFNAPERSARQGSATESKLIGGGLSFVSKKTSKKQESDAKETKVAPVPDDSDDSDDAPPNQVKQPPVKVVSDDSDAEDEATPVKKPIKPTPPAVKKPPARAQVAVVDSDDSDDAPPVIKKKPVKDVESDEDAIPVRKPKARK